MSKPPVKHKHTGFTIVELLIVIVVIGILAAITIVAYNGIQGRAIAASLQSDLDNASKKLKLFQVDNSAYPIGIDCSATPAANTICLKSSNGTTYTTFTPNNTTSPQTFCLTDTNGSVSFVVTDSASPQAGSCSGLLASYYANTTLALPAAAQQVESSINYNWGGASPAINIPGTNFSVQWVGYVTAPATGTYTFQVTSDDGERLYVNNTFLVDEWVPQGPTTWTGTISLNAGQKVPITYQMYQAAGGSVARLEWTPPGGSQTLVPGSAMSLN